MIQVKCKLHFLYITYHAKYILLDITYNIEYGNSGIALLMIGDVQITMKMKKKKKSTSIIDQIFEEAENGYHEYGVKEESKGKFYEHNHCLECKLKDDWEYYCEYIPEFPAYVREEKENCPFKKYRFEIIKCGSRWVSDGIGESFKDWTPDKPVFISSPTGGGKNTFVENVLMPFIEQRNHKNITQNKILILSNRIALRL